MKWVSRMNNLSLVRSENFGEIQCDFWQGDDKEILVTREQIGRALGYAFPQEAIQKIHERNKDRLDRFSGQVKLTTPAGGTQNTTVYTSKGVFEICRFSRQPKADAFMDWAWEVIDTIRKRGMFVKDELLDNPDFAIEVFKQLKAEREEKLRLQERIKTDQPYTNFGKAISAADDGILIGDYAKLLANDSIVTGQNRLFDWLRANGYLIKDGRRKNMPVQRYLEMGLFTVKETCIHTPSGDKIKTTPMITGKGQLYLLNKLKEFEAGEKIS